MALWLGTCRWLAGREAVRVPWLPLLPGPLSPPCPKPSAPELPASISLTGWHGLLDRRPVIYDSRAVLSHLGLPVLPGVPGAQRLMGPGQQWSPLLTAGQSWPQLREGAGVSPRACLQGQRVEVGVGVGMRWRGFFERPLEPQPVVLRSLRFLGLAPPGPWLAPVSHHHLAGTCLSGGLQS